MEPHDEINALLKETTCPFRYGKTQQEDSQLTPRVLIFNFLLPELWKHMKYMSVVKDTQLLVLLS